MYHGDVGRGEGAIAVFIPLTILLCFMNLTRKIQNLFHPNHLQSLVISKYFLSQQTLPKVVVVPR